MIGKHIISATERYPSLGVSTTAFVDVRLNGINCTEGALQIDAAGYYHVFPRQIEMVLESVDRNGAREIVKVAALVIIARFCAALENSQSQSSRDHSKLAALVIIACFSAPLKWSWSRSIEIDEGSTPKWQR